ncbi:MAG TPA: 1,2-phenylacetyl-CoA epoxidase subunit PaaC [Micromonosporaceae bacterium]
MSDLFEYLLRLGDDALIQAQRLGEWSAHAHEMEEDIALANIALDQLGAARMFLTYAGAVEGHGRDEDALAYLRGDAEFRNAQIVEIKDTDFGTAVAKLLCLSTFQHLLYERLAGSRDAQIAAIAGKCVKESAYHVDHAALWTVRLGAGTHESHRRMTAALEEVWPYTYELFVSDEVVQRLGDVAVDPATLHSIWQDRVFGVLQAGELDVPQTNWRPIGGRTGRHTEALSYLLAEMQVLHRADPGATW